MSQTKCPVWVSWSSDSSYEQYMTTNITDFCAKTRISEFLTKYLRPWNSVSLQKTLVFCLANVVSPFRFARRFTGETYLRIERHRSVDIEIDIHMHIDICIYDTRIAKIVLHLKSNLHVLVQFPSLQHKIFSTKWLYSCWRHVEAAWPWESLRAVF